jgi:hypothetical protein
MSSQEINTLQAALEELITSTKHLQSAKLNVAKAIEDGMDVIKNGNLLTKDEYNILAEAELRILGRDDLPDLLNIMQEFCMTLNHDIDKDCEDDS